MILLWYVFVVCVQKLCQKKLSGGVRVQKCILNVFFFFKCHYFNFSVVSLNKMNTVSIYSVICIITNKIVFTHIHVYIFYTKIIYPLRKTFIECKLFIASTFDKIIKHYSDRKNDGPASTPIDRTIFLTIIPYLYLLTVHCSELPFFCI